jgi:hypothetical protein
MEIKRYDTVVLLEPIGAFQVGEKGAVVEVYTRPYAAYDIEMVTDEGKTVGLLEAVRPDQIRPLSIDQEDIRFTSITIEANGARAAVHFSDGTEVIVQADDLYTKVP